MNDGINLKELLFWAAFAGLIFVLLRSDADDAPRPPEPTPAPCPVPQPKPQPRP